MAIRAPDGANNMDEGSAHIIYLTCERSEVCKDMDKQQ